ncbi:GNAT family N-acetyltransferase [Halobacillus litoralis]|uniref:GNAT family N-acetyltransferase n=1 Tax=Halobacillus litoralis TaxID=45668 RepID=A0A410MIA3_9BACI|nr:GNAT family N-acetyltransferase [Halobacillus litoralis]QAS54477.1 GNAT family N-acetyltransferase [Halobacillus litoralis]
MTKFVQPMTEFLAKQSLQWRYQPPYDLYNVQADAETIAERLDGSYQAVFENETFIGFFCTGTSARVPAGYDYGVYEEACVDMGLGMDPVLTGKGNGYEFARFIIEQIGNQKGTLPIRLSVATFNKRAIRLYENLGFVKVDTFFNDTNEFITMIKG